MISAVWPVLFAHFLFCGRFTFPFKSYSLLCLLDNYMSPQRPHWNLKNLLLHRAHYLCFNIFCALTVKHDHITFHVIHSMLFILFSSYPLSDFRVSGKSAIKLFWIEEWTTNRCTSRETTFSFVCFQQGYFTFQISKHLNNSPRITPGYYSLSVSDSFSYLTGREMSIELYTSSTCPTFRRNTSTASFDLYAWLLPEIFGLEPTDRVDLTRSVWRFSGSCCALGAEACRMMVLHEEP